MREHSLFYFQFFLIISKSFQLFPNWKEMKQIVKFVLKPRKCLAISKLLRTFAADLKTKHY